MKTAIIFASTHGTTEKAIIKKMKGDTDDVSNLNEAVIRQFAETFRGESN